MKKVWCVFVECYPDDSGHGAGLESIWTTEEKAMEHLPESGGGLIYYIEAMRVNTLFPNLTEEEEHDIFSGVK